MSARDRVTVQVLGAPIDAMDWVGHLGVFMSGGLVRVAPCLYL